MQLKIRSKNIEIRNKRNLNLKFKSPNRTRFEFCFLKFELVSDFAIRIFGFPFLLLSHSSTQASPHAWIHPVAERIADERERQDHPGQREPRKNRQPGCDLQEILRVPDHCAPTDVGH